MNHNSRLRIATLALASSLIAMHQAMIEHANRAQEQIVREQHEGTTSRLRAYSDSLRSLSVYDLSDLAILAREGIKAHDHPKFYGMASNHNSYSDLHSFIGGPDKVFADPFGLHRRHVF